MPELCEEMMKKGEEIDDNGDTMQIFMMNCMKLLQIKAK